MSSGLAKLAIGLTLSLLVACGSGADAIDTPNPWPSIQTSERLPVGHERCMFAGTKLRTGVDTNGDGRLSDAEANDIELLCDSDPFSSPVEEPGDVPGRSTIEAKGGQGGRAGPGGVFSAALNRNSDGHYAILSTGAADSSFLFPEPSIEPVETPREHLSPPTGLDFEIAAGTLLEVPVLASAPAMVAPGALVADANGALFAFDEELGARAIESLRIGPEARMRLLPRAPLDTGAKALTRISLAGALVNEGSLSVAPSPFAMGLEIQADSYFGAPAAAVLCTPGVSARFTLATRFDNQGLVDTSGIGSQGAAGSLRIQAEQILSSGTLRAVGGDAEASQDAGAGSEIELHAVNSIVNLGLVDASGGSSGRNGGAGGSVSFVAENGYVFNDGAIELSGGSGSELGGPGGALTLLAEGDIHNSGDVSASGGHGGAGAGAAGQILLSTRGDEPNGKVVNRGQLSASAGPGSSTGDPKNGGLVVVLADFSVQHEGDIRVDGSTSIKGGTGGLIQLVAGAMDVHATGSFSARGGLGVDSAGGAGGQLIIDGRAVAIRGALELGGGPSVENNAGPGGIFRVNATESIDLSFTEADLRGAQAPGFGGQAGRIELIANDHIHCEGSLELSGGSGSYGGDGGRFDAIITGSGAFRNACAIRANGGDGSSGPGGQGGLVGFTLAAELRSSAELSASGGRSTHGHGGDGGEVTFISNGAAEARGFFEISGKLAANGGTTMAAAASGGAGGRIDIPLFNDDKHGFEVRLLGYRRIDLSGGDGRSYGGRGGALEINNGLFEEGPSEGATFGERGIVSHVHILANGGQATSGRGGDAGTLRLLTAPLGAGPEAATALYNYGNWELRGGAGETVGGRGGAFSVNTADGIFFLGDIFASGGDASAQAGDGCAGGALGTRGPILFEGGIEARGGHGLLSDAPAGFGGSLSFVSDGTLLLAQSADLSGGDNLARLGEGGGGGMLLVFGPLAEDIVMGQPANVSGGAGLSRGPAGEFLINDYSILLPDDATMTETIQ